MYKKKSTGALRAPWHKKRLYAAGRPAANTRLIVKAAGKSSGKKVTYVRTKGGNTKARALRLEAGNFQWATEKVTSMTRILSVCYNSTNNEIVRTNTLVKSNIVYIDPAPFKDASEKSKDVEVNAQVKSGKLLAKITSRPGQTGKVAGYILEGPELAFYQKKLAVK